MGEGVFFIIIYIVELFDMLSYIGFLISFCFKRFFSFKVFFMFSKFFIVL